MKHQFLDSYDHLSLNPAEVYLQFLCQIFKNTELRK